MIGKCELCLQVRELLESHLLPRALYKRLRLPTSKNPNPVVFNARGERRTSRQAVQHLLCSACEQRFHKNGENWTLNYCARDGRSFKLREALIEHPCEQLMDDIYCYRCEGIPTIDAAALSYFASSVIWRAAVRSWQIDDVVFRRLELNSGFCEALRSYLVGASAFPPDTVLTLLVSSLEEVPLICTLPETKLEKGYVSYFFTIPGFTFMTDTGDRLPQRAHEMCLCTGAGRPLFLTPFADLSNMRDFAKLNPKRAVLKEIKPVVIRPAESQRMLRHEV